MNMESNLELVLGLLRPIKPRRIETDLQDAIATRLAAHDVKFKREYPIGRKNRLDFFVELDTGETLAIETKVKGASGPETERQLLRYAMTGKIDRIILVTTQAFNIRSKSFVIDGKIIPLHCVDLSMNFL